MGKGLIGSLAICLGLMTGSKPAAAEGSAYDFSFIAIDGEPLPLSTYRGKVLLVVNTASRCGFTSQYDGLQALWNSYRDRGLVVLGVPSNDFGGQEPGSEAEIKDFCAVNFHIDFPLTAKTLVRGENAHAFYQWAAREVGVLGVPRWNFHKYLVASNGRLVDWFATTTAPEAERLRVSIEHELAAAGG